MIARAVGAARVVRALAVGGARIVRALAVVLIVVSAGGCDRGRTAPHPSDAAAAPRAAPRSVRIDPALVDAGRVRAARVARRVPTGAIRLPADVVASAEGAAEAGALIEGRIARFEAREGDRVKAGQVLAWIDAPEAARALADVLRARARTETAGRKVARLDGLVASEAASRVALDEARLELELARADLAAARTVLASLGLAEPPATTEAARPRAAQVPVRSPASGVVVERAASLGAHVTPSVRLFRLVSEGRVLVEARLADGAPVAPASGGRARVAPRGGRACDALVLGVLPEVDPATRARKVRLAPEASCAGLVPGAQVDVDIDLAAAADAGGRDVLVVPSSAIVEVKGAILVFVAEPTRGSFEARPIEPGPRVGDDVMVAAGLEEGDEVVVEGGVLLKGELIRAELGGEE